MNADMGLEFQPLINQSKNKTIAEWYDTWKSFSPLCCKKSRSNNMMYITVYVKARRSGVLWSRIRNFSLQKVIPKLDEIYPTSHWAKNNNESHNRLIWKLMWWFGFPSSKNKVPLFMKLLELNFRSHPNSQLTHVPLKWQGNWVLFYWLKMVHGRNDCQIWAVSGDEK